MKKSYQHRKESENLHEIIINLQAHIRGYLVRREIKNKIQWCNIQELHVIKIQVNFFYFLFLFMLLTQLFQKWWRCILFRREWSALLKKIRKQLKPHQRVYTKNDVSKTKYVTKY